MRPWPRPRRWLDFTRYCACPWPSWPFPRWASAPSPNAKTSWSPSWASFTPTTGSPSPILPRQDALQRAVRVPHPKPSRLAGRRRLADHQTELATLLAALAAVGQPDHAAAARAYAAGISQVLPHHPVEYAVAPAGLLALEPGWPMLDELQPGDKELLVASAVAVIANDGVMTVAETELLRMVCALLHCPLPRLA